MVDEKFLQFFAGLFVLNAEHQMHISEIGDKLYYLVDITDRIDKKAIFKYKLASGA